MRSAVTVDQGTVAYSETGPQDAPAIVFVHGAFVDGTLWRKVVPLLEGSYRCVVPDLPLGSHVTPMHPDADLSPPGLAKLIADFVEAVGLEDVTLVGNDTGGALSPARRHQPPGADRAPRADALRRLRELPPAGVPLPAAARASPGRGERGRAGDADPGEPPLADRLRLALEARDPRRRARGTGPRR